MTSPRRIAGNLALDFANTIDWRETGREADHLATPASLAAWARQAGLIDAHAADATQSDATLIGRAHELRETVGTIGSAFAHGSAPPETALDQLRDRLADTLSRAKLKGDPLRPVFAGSDRILGPIAWEALSLFGGPETGRIKECPFHDCRWLFVDRSKNGSRRWCEMATCGNRAKKMAMAGGTRTL